MQLIERERELAELAGLFGECRDGAGRIVLVSGPVAAGKTVLLRAFFERLTGIDAVVLAATAEYAQRTVPLGVLRQLFRPLEDLPELGAEVVRLLDEGIVAAAGFGQGVPSDTDAQAMADVLQGLSGILLDVATRTPVVLAVDDLDHADPASLHCLEYVARRLTRARILLVLNERTGPAPEHPVFHAELASRPHCRRLRVNLLSRQGQTELLAERLDVPVRHWLPAACHALTGGNPLLLRALLEDNHALVPDAAELVVDTAFAHAVQSCLRRGGPSMPGVARALAILGEPASPPLLGRLLGLNPEHVVELVDQLNQAGLLDARRFRHPAVRTVVLDGMAPEERAALHGRAARLLHDHGAAPMVVARHLVAAPGADASWAVPVLAEAAEEALDGGAVQIALSCLRLAYEACGDERLRAKVASTLARAQWQTNPAVVARLLPELTDAAREGVLDRSQTLALLGYLMWHGQAGDAVDVLKRLSAPAADRCAEPARDLEAMRLLLSCGYPDLAGGNAGPMPAAANRHLRAASALAAVLTGEGGDDAAETAEQVLQATRLGNTPVSYVVAALTALVYDDRLEQAARTCDPLLEEAATRRVPVWHAVLAAVRAMICLRQGDLIAAEGHAHVALTRISPAGWGVAIGLPISVMVLATTAMGRYEDAATHLGIAVPEAMFQTPCGLHYLQARGRYRLATGHPHAALSDLRACGELARRWGFDVPGLVTWRTDQAQALLGLGEPAQAGELAGQQLAMARSGASRSRGISLRVRAMAVELRRRLDLLQEAVNVLEQCGDQYELALALADLSRALHALGEHERAFASTRGADRLTRQCGVRPPAIALAGEPGLPGLPSGAPASWAGPDPRAGLTEAERMVAALAAQGHTNRQIADTLVITISTVEQHLTRVYRKLRVNRRADLRTTLWIEPADAFARDA